MADKKISQLSVANTLNNTDIFPVVQNNVTKQTTMKYIGEKTMNNYVAETYNPNTTYFVGDYCVYENKLYRCKVNSTGSFYSSNWEQCTITSELKTKPTTEIVNSENVRINDATSIVLVRGKNLIDYNKLMWACRADENGLIIKELYYPQYWIVTNVIKVNPNTSYIFSHALGTRNGEILEYDSTFNVVNRISETITTAFTTTSNTMYVVVSIWNPTGDPSQETWVQLEEGTTATARQDYVFKKIFVRNIKGTLEQFYSEEKNEEYLLREQKIGRWVNGKELYRSVIKILAPDLNTYIYHGISNISEITDIKLLLKEGSTSYKPLPILYQESNSILPRFSISLYTFDTEKFLLSAGSYYIENKANLQLQIIVEYTK